MMTATVMLSDNSTSIKCGFIGTMITSTLAMNPIGRIRSDPRLSAERAPTWAKAPEAILVSGELAVTVSLKR